MKFALSTNWCNRRLESGEAIADAALELGFDELELGFHTTDFQVSGFRARLSQMPVGSVHAFCPVPISAPQGYPELYPLASHDEDARKLAELHVRRNVNFASEMGADTVVLHAGRVMCDSWFKRLRVSRRRNRGLKLLSVFRQTLNDLRPHLESRNVTLALENLPYYEGFPDETELAALLQNDFGGWVRGWFDTGHDYVRRVNGWVTAAPNPKLYHGMHVNDSKGGDDHLAPGVGKVDFSALKSLAESSRHLVFEPNPTVPAEELQTGLVYLRQLWS